MIKYLFLLSIEIVAENITNTKENNRQIVEALFPLFPTKYLDVNEKKEIDNNKKIYGLYFHPNRDMVSLIELFTEKDYHALMNLLFSVRIEQKMIKIKGIITSEQKEQKENLPLIVQYYFRIKSTLIKPYYQAINVNKIGNNIKNIEYSTTTSPVFVVNFTEEEKKALKKMIMQNNKIKNLWIIYKNFDNLYEKEFLFFSPDGKKLNTKEGKNLFLHMFIHYLYDCFDQECY
jgi:hypothetical protein